MQGSPIIFVRWSLMYYNIMYWLCWLNCPSMCFFFRAYRIWETPGQGSAMRQIFQKASEGLRRTSILQQSTLLHTHIHTHVLFDVVVNFALNFDSRAVEFFIRDKYEKKKYYSKNVTNGGSVCILIYTVLAQQPTYTYTLQTLLLQVMASRCYCSFLCSKVSSLSMKCIAQLHSL